MIHCTFFRQFLRVLVLCVLVSSCVCSCIVNLRLEASIDGGLFDFLECSNSYVDPLVREYQ